MTEAEFLTKEGFKKLQKHFNTLLNSIENKIIVSQLKTLWIVCASQNWQYTRLGMFAIKSLVGLTYQITA